MKTKNYFNVVSLGYNKELEREELQIHAGENGNIFLIKTEEGFVIDVYGQEENVGSLVIWEDDLTPDTEEEKKWIRMADDSEDGEDGDCDELCPHCDTEVKLKNEFEVQKCSKCEMPILPCSICTHGSDDEHSIPCDCSTCPLEANVREQYIEIIISNMGDNPKYDDSNRTYLEGLSTQTLINKLDEV